MGRGAMRLGAATETTWEPPGTSDGSGPVAGDDVGAEARTLDCPQGLPGVHAVASARLPPRAPCPGRWPTRDLRIALGRYL